MKNKRNALYGLVILLAGVINLTAQAQPNQTTRNLIRDSKGNIWLAAFDGIFRYDGKSFTNITGKVSSARFFSVFEDSRGIFWFGSVGSGVYRYDGKSFKNFTTKDGLAGNAVTNIYEDKTGNIWFGTESGASLYDGKSFRVLKMKDTPPPTVADSVHISAYKKPLPESSWMHNDVNAIIEDRTGKFWFGTRGYAFVYDGKTFIRITDSDGKPFANICSIVEDKQGNIWLGGNDGLWRYNGAVFHHITRNFVGCIYEDKKGNIWTSSESADIQDWPGPIIDESSRNQWVLSRYDEKSLADERPTVTIIKPNKGGLFGILEANDGSIWFGALGVYRYDGKTVTRFTSIN